MPSEVAAALAGVPISPAPSASSSGGVVSGGGGVKLARAHALREDSPRCSIHGVGGRQVERDRKGCRIGGRGRGGVAVEQPGRELGLCVYRHPLCIHTPISDGLIVLEFMPMPALSDTAAASIRFDTKRFS